MRFFAVIVLITAVASAEQIKSPSAVINHILDAIAALRPEPVAVGPAIVDAEPISVGPAMIEPEYEPISVGPAMVDFPLPDEVVAPSPVTVVPGPVADVPGKPPLVQIIVNINQAAGSKPIPVSPVDISAPEIEPTPVHVVDDAPEPVQVVEIAPEPVHVVEVAPIPSPIGHPIAVNPIGVEAPEIEPVQVGAPIIPAAAVVLPQLN